jgi:hypothetical protein
MSHCGVQVPGADLRRICHDLMVVADVTNATLQGTRICDTSEDVLVGYVGNPSWLDCGGQVKCSMDPNCN